MDRRRDASTASVSRVISLSFSLSLSHAPCRAFCSTAITMAPTASVDTHLSYSLLDLRAAPSPLHPWTSLVLIHSTGAYIPHSPPHSSFTAISPSPHPLAHSSLSRCSKTCRCAVSFFLVSISPLLLPLLSTSVPSPRSSLSVPVSPPSTSNS